MKRRQPLNILVVKVTLPPPRVHSGVHRISWTRGPCTVGPTVGGRVTTDPQIFLKDPSTQPDPDGG